MPVDSIATRALRRIREELDTRGISQRELALRLTNSTREHWSQPRIGKILTGRVELKLDDAAAIGEAINLPLMEIIRDRGLEFYAELAPTEVRLLEHLRQWPEAAQAIMFLLRLTPKLPSSDPKQHTKRKVGRPRNSELAVKTT